MEHKLTVYNKQSLDNQFVELTIRENKFNIELIIPMRLHISINRSDWDKITGKDKIKKAQAIRELKESINA